MRHVIRLFSLFYISLCLSCQAAKPETEGQLPAVVAMTPSLTEALFAAAPKAKLLATSQHCQWPEAAVAAKKLPSAGILESILALQPDLVLLHTSDKALAEKLRRLDIQTLSHSMDTVDGIMQAIAAIGEVLGQKAVADASIARLKTEIAEVESRYAYRKLKPKPRTLLIVDRADARGSHFYIAQNTAYLAHLLTQCGADVISVNAKNWAQIDAERLMRLAPEHIVYFAHGEADAKASSQIFKDYYAELPAIKSKNFVVLDNASLAVPGTRVAQSMETVCAAIEGFF